MTRLIDADRFLQDMADLYRQAGWDEREVHFSLADLRSNIDMEDVVLIPRREADTVQVIRCRDCAYYRPYSDGRYDCDNMLGMADAYEDGYCSRAERREE